MEQFRGTTIVAVKKDGKTVIAGDGQVTMQQSVIFKNNATKVRRLYNNKVITPNVGNNAGFKITAPINLPSAPTATTITLSFYKRLN